MRICFVAVDMAGMMRVLECKKCPMQECQRQSVTSQGGHYTSRAALANHSCHEQKMAVVAFGGYICGLKTVTSSREPSVGTRYDQKRKRDSVKTVLLHEMTENYLFSPLKYSPSKSHTHVWRFKLLDFFPLFLGLVVLGFRRDTVQRFGNLAANVYRYTSQTALLRA